MQNKNAFTLIELLIVVAIIGILAAIAVPNFLNAQVRAKLSRMQADHRALKQAEMMYFMDKNTFHFHTHAPGQHVPLTTPIAYMSTWPTDVFQESKTVDKQITQYAQKTIHWEPVMGFNHGRREQLLELYPNYVGWNVSAGPANEFDTSSPVLATRTYDVTNGLMSSGLIYTFVSGNPDADYIWHRLQ